jgi:hypothetical protein
MTPLLEFEMRLQNRKIPGPYKASAAAFIGHCPHGASSGHAARGPYYEKLIIIKVFGLSKVCNF